MNVPLSHFYFVLNLSIFSSVRRVRDVWNFEQTMKIAEHFHQLGHSDNYRNNKQLSGQHYLNPLAGSIPFEEGSQASVSVLEYYCNHHSPHELACCQYNLRGIHIMVDVVNVKKMINSTDCNSRERKKSGGKSKIEYSLPDSLWLKGVIFSFVSSVLFNKCFKELSTSKKKKKH